MSPLRRAYTRNPRLWLFGILGLILIVIIVCVILALPSKSKQSAPEVSATPEPVQEEAIPAAAEAPRASMVRDYQVLENIPNTDRAIGLPESARVDDSYFDDALFVGDSVTLKFSRYITEARKVVNNTGTLGKSYFLAAQSFSARNALAPVTETSIHPTIAGKKMTLEDAVAMSGAKKLYIMLGMNDAGVTGVNTAVRNMCELLGRIREKAPDITIFVESATPRLSGEEPTTQELFDYDIKLYEAVLEMDDPNLYFVDVAYVMRDAEGKLIEEYCGDPSGMALHFTNAGCREWAEYLYTHAIA